MTAPATAALSTSRPCTAEAMVAPCAAPTDCITARLAAFTMSSGMSDLQEEGTVPPSPPGISVQVGRECVWAGSRDE